MNQQKAINSQQQITNKYFQFRWWDLLFRCKNQGSKNSCLNHL